MSSVRCFILLGALVVFAPTATASEQVQHGVVYHRAGEFAGWPANGGLWAWGDEMLVGFDRWTYEPAPTSRHHTKEPYLGSSFARSRDGGLTWQPEERAPFVPHDRPIDFTHPDFALRLWKGNYFLSDNRAATWRGPIALPVFQGLENYARSNAIVLDAGHALLFLSTAATDTTPTGSYVARLSADGTVEYLTRVGDDLFDHVHVPPAADPYVHSTMPAAVRIAGDHYVCAVRQRVDNDRWSDIYESRDGGRTWRYLSELERGSDNPISLVTFGEGTIAAIYGWRPRPYGLRARLSRDAGRTWEPEIILRDDALNNDIGYTRATVRPDGAVVILYYYTTAERPEQHIAVTIWRPAGVPKPPAQVLLKHAFGGEASDVRAPTAFLSPEGRLGVSFLTRCAYAHYEVQASGDLQDWTPIGAVSGGGAALAAVMDPLPAARRFLRVKVTFLP